MIDRLRWLLLAPSILASWLGVFYVFASYHRSLTAPCESGPMPAQCGDPLHVFLVQALPSFGAAVSAVLVLTVTFVVAPVAKIKAARLCFCIGMAIAITGIWVNAVERNWDYFFAACSALIAGLVALKVISWIHLTKQFAITHNAPMNAHLSRSRGDPP